MLYEVEKSYFLPTEVVKSPRLTTPAVSLILPAYNEEAALPRVLSDLFDTLDTRYEVIVVDDGSSDRTAQIAAQYPCRLIRHTVNQGKGAAVRTGLAAARGEYILLMDADNTYPVQALPKMAQLLETHDFVRCLRRINPATMPVVNRVGNLVFDTVLKLLHGLEGGDYMTGLYGLRREALDKIDFCSDGFDMEVEIGIKAQACGLRSTSFPIDYQERLGAKKLKPLQDGWRILKRILIMALLYNPLLSFILPGMVVWALTLLLLVTLRADGMLSSEQNLIITALGSSGGFQLVIFGVCAAFYGLKNGITPHQRQWLLKLGGPSSRHILMLLGGLLSLLGLLGLGNTMLNSFNNGGRLDNNSAMLAGVLFVLGMQMIFAGLFISMFANFGAKGQAR